LTASWRGGYQHKVRTLNLTINPRDFTACQIRFYLLQLIPNRISFLKGDSFTSPMPQRPCGSHSGA
jgi:hypothetical protein